MPPRPRLPDLARSFDAVDDPLYVVDAERRIVFVNKACAAWLGREPQDLIGRECRYAVALDADAHAVAADALCPPPAAFAGRRTTAEIVSPAGTSGRVEFLPLAVGEAGAALVLGWLPAAAASATLDEERQRDDAQARRLHALLAHLHRDAGLRYAPERLIGVSPAIERVRRQIALAAATSASVTIVGPAGVGKSHVARTIYALRMATDVDAASSPLVPLDGPTLDAESLQATIRNLARSQKGDARRAPHVLIHDVDRLPAAAQNELAGWFRLIDLPIRWFSTARQPLSAGVAVGAFRADLASRLATLVMEVPPLVDRPEDIPPLAQHFVEQASLTGPRRLGGFTDDALERLSAYGWPRNVAELAEVVAESCAQAEGPLVTAERLPRRLQYAADAARLAARDGETIVLDDVLAELEAELLQRALRRARGNKTRAAELLGVTRSRLLRRLQQLGLEQGPVIFEEVDDAAAASPEPQQ